MGKQVDLLINYPKAKRNIKARSISKTEEDRKIAREFGKDFFDGDRKHGYGGYVYNPIYWSEVVKTFKDYWKLDSNSKVLDIGCGKGFMLYDLQKLIKGIEIRGVDISKYAIENSIDSIKNYLSVGNANNLLFEDNYFDVVISINTIHNLDKDQCAKSLQEINRVSKKFSFITVDAYRNEQEKKRMFDWNLTAKTILSVDEWKIFFKENNYKGDFNWFTP